MLSLLRGIGGYLKDTAGLLGRLTSPPLRLVAATTLGALLFAVAYTVLVVRIDQLCIFLQQLAAGALAGSAWPRQLVARPAP